MELVFFSEEVLYLSVLTLILKALPPDNGSSAHFAAGCIDTARRGLEKHEKFIETIGLDKGHYIDVYVNWYGTPCHRSLAVMELHSLAPGILTDAHPV
jgi:hypothetical protein